MLTLYDIMVIFIILACIRRNTTPKSEQRRQLFVVIQTKHQDAPNLNGLKL